MESAKIVRSNSAEINGEDHEMWDGEFYTIMCILLGASFTEDLLPWFGIFQLGEGKDGWVVIDNTGKMIGQRMWVPLKEYIDRIASRAPALMKEHKWSKVLLELQLETVQYLRKYDPEKVVNFAGLALVKKLRGTGIAEVLMQKSIETIQALGTYKHITVQCTSVRSRKWMEKFGFRVEKELSYPEEYQNSDLLKQAGFDSVQYYTIMVLDL